MNEDESPGLRRALGTPKIVFLVVAAAAPLVAMAGTVPLSIGVGNGPGIPGAYLVATVTLLLFSVGYAAMSRHITRGGGFYTYIAQGLGRPPAAAGAIFALVAYNCLVAALAGGFGYFLVSGLGLPVPWWPLSLVAVAVMGLLGYRSINVSARVLAVLMVCEIAVLLVFDIAVIAGRGADAFTWTSFAPGTVLSGAPGVAFMFAFGSFAGFEAAALYAEETPEPARTVPRATYAAVLVIGVFYLFTSWMMVGAVGAGQVKAVAARDSGEFFLNVSAQRLGEAASSVFGLLIITSVFASLLSAHNASSRYLFALGRDRLLPSALGRVHARHRSPYVSSLTQTAFTVLVVAVFAIGGLDPYRQLVTIMSGLSTLGIILLQTFAAIAIIAFFRRRGDRRYGRTLAAPVLGCVGMITTTVLLLANFETLAGSGAIAIRALPYIVLAVAVLAACYTLWLRRAHADRYAGLGDGAGREAAPLTRGER